MTSGLARLTLRFIPVATVLGLFAGCSSRSTTTSAPTSTYTLTAPSVAVNAGQERYVCDTVTLDQDLSIDGIEYVPQDYVHHLFLSQSTVPVQDGVAECDVVFETTWLPIFVGGKGSTGLLYPQGDANVLPKGSQLVLQLHLLNTSATDQTVNVSLALHLSTAEKPAPVGLYVFGTQDISLPALATTSVSNVCTPDQDVSAFAIFPHMHQLGTKMTFEVADDAGNFTQVYARDPYSFNAQSFDQMPLVISKGTQTRITCTYDNTTNATVTYGESSYNEMCYLAMYVPGMTGAIGCVALAPVDGGAEDGGSCTPTANSLGIGAPCTAGGGQCGSGLACSADEQAPASGAGFCLKIGCSGASDCGAGATCCAPAQGGGAVKVCLPTECVPSDCVVESGESGDD